MRTISMLGTACTINSASSVSRSVAPRSCALVQRLLDGGHHARMAVAEDQRSPRGDIIEVAVAIDVEEERAFTAGDERRLAADGAKARAGC